LVVISMKAIYFFLKGERKGEPATDLWGKRSGHLWVGKERERGNPLREKKTANGADDAQKRSRLSGGRGEKPSPGRREEGSGIKRVLCFSAKENVGIGEGGGLDSLGEAEGSLPEGRKEDEASLLYPAKGGGKRREFANNGRGRGRIS